MSGFVAAFAGAQRLLRIGTFVAIAAGLFVCAQARASAQNVPFNGGPIMQKNAVYQIFWLPTASVYDSSVAGGIGNYETLLTQFFNDVSATTYYSVVGQYSGTCDGGICFVQNSPGAVNVAGTFVDRRAYAHADGTAATGTIADPLLDADIQHEVQTIINDNQGLNDGTNAEYFVYLAAGIQECFGAPAGGTMCTFFNPANVAGLTFCAYHSKFTDAGGNSAVYGVMPDANSMDGCNEGLSLAPNGQISSDQEVALTSHEFFESVSDPLLNAWTSTGGEIGDLCNQIPGPLRNDGSNVSLNGVRFAVQEIWSNFTSSCSVGLPSVQLTIGTGGDDLRGDSSATAGVVASGGTTLQSFTLKTQNQAAWPDNSTNQQMFGFNSLTPPQFASVLLTLTSHSGFGETPDNWNVQSVVGQELDAAGNVICQFSGSGNPLFRLTGSAPSQTLPAPSCGQQGPAPVPLLKSVMITIVTGNDDARSDTELWASLPGETTLCLKPSNNADPDGICNNGGSARDQNGKQSWENWQPSAQTFTLAAPAAPSTLGTLTLQLVEHDSGFEGDDNWDVQSILVTGTDTSNNVITLLNVGNSGTSGNTCIVRLTGSKGSFTFNLSASNPTGANPGIPPGSCPQ
jgi:hypothetical protein